jgi:hypothetical protein
VRRHLRVESLEARSLLTTLTVTTTDDSGPGSLRQAILDADAASDFAAIQFDIPGPGVHTIAPTSALPPVTGVVSIDGYTQPGSRPNSQFHGDDATLLVDLDGEHAGPDADGLMLTGPLAIVKGLVIRGFAGNAIRVAGSGSVEVGGDFLGTDPSGSRAMGNGGDGVRIEGTGQVSVGGTFPAVRNVIAANGGAGVRVGPGAETCLVQGNFIGTDASGLVAMGNLGPGVAIQGSVGATIGEEGGDSPAIGDVGEGAGNVIAGNGGDGIVVTDSSNLSISGNTIGADAGGAGPLGNSGRGVLLQSCTATTITSDIIAASGSDGISVIDSSASSIRDNLIGTDAAGDAGLGNASAGVAIYGGSHDNTVGGPIGGDRNVISGNRGSGVTISGAGTFNNYVESNFIGTDPTGARPRGNALDAVAIFAGASANRIGGESEVVGNLIAGNAAAGVAISGPTTRGNRVQGNSIGVEVLGRFPLGNGGRGVIVFDGASANLIGGTAADLGNVIAFNGSSRGGEGVGIVGGTGDAILGNSIHDNADLGIDLGSDGVTANGPGDRDTGANDLQNYPALASASPSFPGVGTVVRGVLSGPARTGYHLEFFSSPAPDPSGHGEGRTFLGTLDAATNAAGLLYFTVTLKVAVPVGQYLTATATGPGGNTSEFSTARRVTLHPLPAAFADYDGDGQADLATFRPTNGLWTIAQSTAGPRTVIFGQAGDIPVMGDFDGDGKSDLAVYRPSAGLWIILDSSTGHLQVVRLGAAGDIPVPADYDGDGKTDIAVYRPSTGQWFIQQSSAGFKSVRLGAPGLDQPVPADYDGDGKADVAVYRPSTAQWIILQSSAGARVIAFGARNTDIPVPADYDGDGKADLAVFRPSTGQWLSLRSTSGPQVVTLGSPGLDTPVPADYDGDGKADIAVYRRTGPLWIIIGSTAGEPTVASGATTSDVPVPTPLALRFRGNLQGAAFGTGHPG